MWVRDKESQESYIHICDGLTEKKMRSKKIEIRLHDVSIFTFIKDDKCFHIEHIKFCPYCGIELKDVVN
jgi:hypothetical protein